MIFGTGRKDRPGVPAPTQRSVHDESPRTHRQSLKNLVQQHRHVV